MSDRLMRFALLALVVLFAGYVAEPYVTRFFFAAETPRPVAARGELAEAEQSTVGGVASAGLNFSIRQLFWSAT